LNFASGLAPTCNRNGSNQVIGLAPAGDCNGSNQLIGLAPVSSPSAAAG